MENNLPIGSWKNFPLKLESDKQTASSPSKEDVTSGDTTRRPIPGISDHYKSSPSFDVLHEIIRRQINGYVLSPIDWLRYGLSSRVSIAATYKKQIRRAPFEANQTAPVFSIGDRKQQKKNDECLKRRFSRTNRKEFAEMDKIRVDGANGLRFSARKKGCFTPGTGSPFSGTFATSASESLLRIPKTGINPNKAVFTIDSKTSEILIVNNNACQLLGYTPRELCGMQFSSLLSNRDSKNHVSALAEGQLNSEDGTMVLLSGKVVEMNTKCSTKVGVSLWIRQIDNDGRCLAVAEPVERRIAQIVIDKSGTIVSADVEAVMLFQVESEDHFIGMDIQTLIPAIKLPDRSDNIVSKLVRKQKATGKTTDGISFPLCLMVTTSEEMSNENNDSGLSGNNLFVVTIWVFQNISGLLVIDENGQIESCNHHFSMLMFGFSQARIIRTHITGLIPNFGQEFEYLGHSRSRNITTSSLDESETETDPVYFEADQSSLYKAPVAVTMSEYQTNASWGPLDLSKAISEPVNICPDLVGKTPNVDGVGVHNQKTPTATGSSKGNILAKSLSECGPNVNENEENNQNTVNAQPGQVSDKSNIMVSNKETNNQELTPSKNEQVPFDEELCIEANELLTPVNETEPPSEYLMSSSTKTVSNAPYVTEDLDEALRDLESESDTSKDISAIRVVGTPNCDKRESMASLPPVTSTPDLRRTSNVNVILPANASAPLLQQPLSYNDGKYKGEAVHSDGNVLDVLYTISSQELPCGRRVYCVWICRDMDSEYDEDYEDDDGKHPNLTLTFNSVTSTVETSLCGNAHRHSVNASMAGVSGTANPSSSRPNSVSLLSQCEEEQVCGDYSKYYTTLKQIGKGAYGYVKMAFRHTDRLLVITKFILKEKLAPQFMVQTEDKKEVPMEVYLLSTVKHPNIVAVLDVFENEKFFQMVMEKHGSGMDLFEFIDRRPMIDEPLGCYIFRQIANAVDYLHSIHILHRDIKDENIIIDQYFHVKLIDFGSATFMEEGKLFSTFYGTTEYCSPEVLAGNKYAGPELEIWALGVTLFVLMFFENPFLDIEETLRAELNMPHAVSSDLENILFSMLDKNPKTRITMKELLDSDWIKQEINPASFNFAWIVPCEGHEANPDKYFSGQVYSSTTGLSTTSPHDSLSLADEDSMIDADEDIEDEEQEEDQSIQSQNETTNEPVSQNASLQLVTPSTSAAVSTSSASGKPQSVQKHACKNSDLSKSGSNPCRRNHSFGNILDSTPLTNHSVKCPCSQLILATSCTSRNVSNKSHTSDTKRQSICSLDHPNSHAHNLVNIKPIDTKKSESSKVDLMSTKNGCKPLAIYSPNERITISCGLLGSRSDTSVRPKSCHIPCGFMAQSLGTAEEIDIGLDQIVSTTNSSLLSVNSSFSTGGSSGNTSILKDSVSINLSQSGATSPMMISLSKSETNIFDGKAVGGNLAIYNVVSLNDLNESDPFLNRRQMNDLSKNQFLNNLSANEIRNTNKKMGTKMAVHNEAVSISDSDDLSTLDLDML